MQQISIIGLGLIGSSIGLALHKWMAGAPGERSLNITGFDTEHEHELKAKQIKAVDGTSWDLLSAVEHADLVILAVPVLAIKEVLTTIAPHLPEGCVVTDTASTKKQVLQWAGEILPDHVSFIGGHPMAGGLAGVDEPSADLFNKCTYCIVSSPKATEGAALLVNGLVAAVGATPYYLDPAEHDSYVAAVSHLPLLSAVALVETTTQSAGWRDIRRVASTGFRDTTRLASGDPIMARDIVATNREAIAYWLENYIARLQSFKDLVEGEGDIAADFESIFTDAKTERDKWLKGWEKGSFEERPEKSDIPGVGEMMGRMFLGGLIPKRKK
jgi:prephenate dehydrogenase